MSTLKPWAVVIISVKIILLGITSLLSFRRYCSRDSLDFCHGMSWSSRHISDVVIFLRASKVRCCVSVFSVQIVVIRLTVLPTLTNIVILSSIISNDKMTLPVNNFFLFDTHRSYA